jgi:hypothetical protein
MARLTVGQFAERLGVDIRTVKRWEKAEKIPKARRDPQNVRWWDEDDVKRVRAWRRRLAEAQRGLPTVAALPRSPARPEAPSTDTAGSMNAAAQ